MNRLLMLAAMAEAGLGVILLIDPSMVVKLLVGGEIAGAGVIVSRFAGIALIGLGIACLPGVDGRPAFYGMLTYSVLALFYFVYIGIHGEFVGPLLWPAAILHAILSVLLGVAWSRQRKGQARG